MCDFSLALGESFLVSKSGIFERLERIPPNLNRTFDRNIAGGAFEVHAALLHAYDSLP
jgi:hypothetical protein